MSRVLSSDLFRLFENVEHLSSPQAENPGRVSHGLSSPETTAHGPRIGFPDGGNVSRPITGGRCARGPDDHDVLSPRLFDLGRLREFTEDSDFRSFKALADLHQQGCLSFDPENFCKVGQLPAQSMR